MFTGSELNGIPCTQDIIALFFPAREDGQRTTTDPQRQRTFTHELSRQSNDRCGVTDEQYSPMFSGEVALDSGD